MAKAALIISCILTSLFTGCVKKADVINEKKSDKIILGFSQIGAESAWRTYNSKSIQTAADKEGIQILFSNAEQKQENQIKAIRSFIVYQVDVIAFVPIVQDGWDNVLKEAKAAGIPVIVCDRKIETSEPGLYAGYIGTDSVEEGRRAARFLQHKFKGVSGHLNILEVRGTDGSSASDGRIQGFHECIDADSRFSIIYSESGDFIRSRGREIMRRILADNGGRLQIDGNPVDIIFSANDGMTLGILSALEERNIRTGNYITVVSVDGQQEAVDLLKEGRINCIVECNPDLGPQIMTLVKKLAAGEEIPQLTHVDGRVFSENEDAVSIGPRGY